MRKNDTSVHHIIQDVYVYGFPRKVSAMASRYALSSESMAGEDDMLVDITRVEGTECEAEDDESGSSPSEASSPPDSIMSNRSPGENMRGSWPRSFEQSMTLYCGSRGNSRKSREFSSSEGPLTDSSMEDSEPSFRPWIKPVRRGKLVSALTPLLSESNLVQLEQSEIEQQKHKDAMEEREREKVREREDEMERVRQKERNEQHARRVVGQGKGHGFHSHMKVQKVMLDDSEPAAGDCDGKEESSGTGFAETTFNAVNMLLGVGVLSTPYAAAQGGWLSLLLVPFFALVFFSTGIFLKDCLESRPNIYTYPDIGETAFGQTGRWITAVLLYVELYSVTVDLMILEGDNLSTIFPSATLDLGWIILRPNQTMLILTAVCILPSVLLKDVSFLAYLSACGVLASLLVVFAVGWIGVADGTAFQERGTLVRWSGVPVAIGMYSFCFSGHTVLPVVYCAMKDTNRFSSVLVVSFSLSAMVYVVIAVMGYSMYGDNVASQITLNLAPDSLMSKAALWTTVINPLTKFALMMTPLATAIEELVPPSLEENSAKILGALIRTVLVFSAMFVALAVPFFGFVMAFIGAFLGISMSVIFPCAFYIRLVGGKTSKLKMMSAIMFIIVGVILAVIGTYSSVSNILSGLEQPSPPVGR